MDCDNLLVLNAGKLMESGSPAELASKKGGLLSSMTFSKMDSQRIHVETLTQQLSSLVFNFSTQLCCSNGGTLCQVWMPEEATVNSAPVLTTNGMPFCLAGNSDLLALYRCVSTRYRFSSDASTPAFMGAVGRVYRTLESESSSDFQANGREGYLVSEAKRCNVHSTFLAALFHESTANQLQPVAVFELVLNDKGAISFALLNKFTECAKACGFSTCDWDRMSVPSAPWSKESPTLCPWSSKSLEHSNASFPRSDSDLPACAFSDESVSSEEGGLLFRGID
eukprot:gene23795-9357_t